MVYTKELFDERVAEIEIFYNELIRFYEEDRNDVLSISKSTFIIMLYNLIEACIREGFKEIYEKIHDETPTHESLNEPLVEKWIGKVIKDNKNNPEAYLKKLLLQLIILPPREVTIGRIQGLQSISSGNLDKKNINELLKDHGIDTRRSNRLRVGESTITVRKFRNDLSHGNISFKNAMNDYAVEAGEMSISKIKEDVLNYMESVIEDMNEFYTNRLYLKQLDNENIEEGLI